MPYNPAGDAEDFQFIALCIKHSDAKLQPDHDMVAKEMGIEKKATSAARFNAIMRKWGPAAPKTTTHGMKVTKPDNKRKRESEKVDDDDDGNEIKEEAVAEKTNGQAQDASENEHEDVGTKKKLKVELRTSS